MYWLPTSTLQNDGILFRTRDGGAHWTLLSTPIAGDLAFTSDSVGVVYGEQPNSEEMPMRAWYTTDAGSNWKRGGASVAVAVFDWSMFHHARPRTFREQPGSASRSCSTAAE